MNDKNKKLQAKIARLVKAGKPLGGLLAGMMATTTLAGSETNAVPRLAGVPMPRRPAPIAVTNAGRQVDSHHVRGRISPPKHVKTNEVFSVSSSVAQTNKVNEGVAGRLIRGEPAAFVEMGEPPSLR